MSQFNSHHEEEFQDMDYFRMKIGKEYESGKTIEEIAVEYKRPAQLIEQLVQQYNANHK